MFFIVYIKRYLLTGCKIIVTTWKMFTVFVGKVWESCCGQAGQIVNEIADKSDRKCDCLRCPSYKVSTRDEIT